MMEGIKVPILVRDKENGAYYVSIQVVERFYRLIKDQKVFYNTHSKTMLESCKAREKAFEEWYLQVLESIGKDTNKNSTE